MNNLPEPLPYEPLLNAVAEALDRSPLKGWSVERLDATTWEVSTNEPSGMWTFYYTIIVFASPRSVLVLAGNIEQTKSLFFRPNQFVEGRWMPDVWLSEPLGWIQYKTLDLFLSAQFHQKPPNVRSTKRICPAEPRNGGPSLEEFVARQFQWEDVHNRFEVKVDDESHCFFLYPQPRESSILRDYRIMLTKNPEGVLVVNETQEREFLWAYEENVVYIPKEQAHEPWLNWVLKNRAPNIYGLI